MASSEFVTGSPGEEGIPSWITGLASDDPNHTVLAVRDLAPRETLLLLGATQEEITPCELPSERPDTSVSLPRAAFGVDDGGGSVLLAGHIGAWTFVYDDGGLTPLSVRRGPHPAAALSANGREAVTSTRTINAAVDFVYAANGELLCSMAGGLDPADGEEAIPRGLWTAVAAAGYSGSEEPGATDTGIASMRVLCAKAGLLRVTVDDLRQIPLLMAPLGDYISASPLIRYLLRSPADDSED